MYFVDCLTERLGNFVYGDKILLSCFLSFCCRLVSAWVLENKDRSMHLKDAHSGSEANILCCGPAGGSARGILLLA